MAAERRRRLLVAAVVVVVVAGGATAFALTRREQPVAAGAQARPPTAEVTRTDLVQTTRAEGVLGYDGSFSVPAAPGGGIATWLPAPGSVVRRGERVYAVDNRAVPLLIGDTPLWRELGEGVADGPDVRLLRANLRDLGFGANLLDNEHFSGAVGDAVARWQEALGVEPTRVVRPGDVVVAAWDLRIVEVRATLGGPLPTVVATASGTGRVVTVDLPVARQGLAAAGAAVRVLLPTGAATPGTVASVGTVATPAPRDPGSAEGDPAEATVPVRVTLDDPAAAGTLDGAPVSVEFVSETHPGVLAVPLVALLAMPDGNYAVDVVESGEGGAWSRRRVVVRLGFFANGLVEVSADGLAEGVEVQVPER
ncbi:peptidoglycan-binding protein [Actinosynnema sp. NPDC059797]